MQDKRQPPNRLAFGICSRSPSSVCRLTFGFALSISKRVCIFSSVNLETLCPSRCDSKADPERNIWLTDPPILTISWTAHAQSQSVDTFPFPFSFPFLRLLSLNSVYLLPLVFAFLWLANFCIKSFNGASQELV